MITNNVIKNGLLVKACSNTPGLQASIPLESYTSGEKEENTSFTANFKKISSYFEGKYMIKTLKVGPGLQNACKICKHKSIIKVSLRTPYLFGILKWVWVLELYIHLYIIFRERIVHAFLPNSFYALFQM